MKFIVAWKHRDLIGYSNRVKEFDSYEYSLKKRNAKVEAMAFASRLQKMRITVYAIREVSSSKGR